MFHSAVRWLNTLLSSSPIVRILAEFSFFILHFCHFFTFLSVSFPSVLIYFFFVHSLDSLALFTEPLHCSYFLSACFTSSPNFSPNLLLICELFELFFTIFKWIFLDTVHLKKKKKKCHDVERQGLFTASPTSPHYLRLHSSFTVCTVTAAFATKQLARPTENPPISQPELENVRKSEKSTLWSQIPTKFTSLTNVPGGSEAKRK